MHRRKETHTKIAYFSFRCMTLVQRKGTGKGILDWGQTLQGLKKKNRQPQKSITGLFLVVWHNTQNDDAKQKCQREC